ncbi:MAG: M28 family peptidase, partial [Bacteroidia bacterium]|nr:M28 family peptidase [Bacteroidia bacterium]
MIRKFLYILLFLPLFASAQRQGSAQNPKPATDKSIQAMVDAVSADSIKAYIYKMVSFKTRHSLSDTSSNSEGIGAARRWVASKFRQFAQQNRADMQVDLDPYEITPNPRSPRVPYTMTMKNVLGTLAGSDPADTRVLLVSGHLDSRNTNVMDSVGLAPGANDDSSSLFKRVAGAYAVAAQAYSQSRGELPRCRCRSALDGRVSARHWQDLRVLLPARRG